MLPSFLCFLYLSSLFFSCVLPPFLVSSLVFKDSRFFFFIVIPALLVCDTKFRLPDPISLYSFSLFIFFPCFLVSSLPSYCSFPLSRGSANSSNVQQTAAAHLTPLLDARINQLGHFHHLPLTSDLGQRPFHPFLWLLYPPQRCVPLARYRVSSLFTLCVRCPAVVAAVFLRSHKSMESVDPQFTMRRKMEQLREELELMEQLRDVRQL